MSGVTCDFEGLENFNLEDLHELPHEEKEEVKKQIEAIYIEATSLEKKAIELAITCQLDRIGAEVIAPEQLRTNVVNYISTHPSFEDVTEWRVRRPCCGHWNVQNAKRDIVIVTSAPSTNTEDSVFWVTGCDGFSGDPILLGHIFENHYQSLQPKAGTSRITTAEIHPESGTQVAIQQQDQDQQVPQVQTFIFNATALLESSTYFPIFIMDKTTKLNRQKRHQCVNILSIWSSKNLVSKSLQDSVKTNLSSTIRLLDERFTTSNDEDILTTKATNESVHEYLDRLYYYS
ncbi:unnamed protein product [Mytilus coruscus]|uniref:Uncharacterized protein n=1 Tax=Mytilus coruscus TaxID=42192 RepID=A0A6J8EPB0_MYTCO|nr:unnamed protein product [Mytilus coruscus]